MTVHVHRLDGCAPTPLAHYLKALAVLRLVAEQRDPSARGFWKDERFWLATQLSREELVRFFLDEYAPTPMLSPWNGGSGFYYANDPGLTPLESSTAPRFRAFRDGIGAARRMAGPLADAILRVKEAEKGAKKAGNKKDPELKAAQLEKTALKDALLAACRREWSGGLLQWFDAALALDAAGGASWPALLGSGGNDGRLDFTNNAMQHLATLFDIADPLGASQSEAAPLLGAALFGVAAKGLSKKAVGQFLPGSAGGGNMSTGFGGESTVNPWDFVLMLEGAVAFASTIVRTADTNDLPQAAAPFAMRPNGSGYGSAAAADETPRGEQWMPLWIQPASWHEVTRLFAEARMRLGRDTGTRAVDAARAIARLGVARGITEFQRYGFIERNGQANLAVPLARWQVGAQPNADLLDDFEIWIGRLRWAARDGGSTGLRAAVRRVDESILALCRRVSPDSWQRLLVAMSDAERALASSPGTTGDAKRGLTPIPVLRPGWIAAADDGSPEFRLAVALASQDVLLSYRGRDVASNIRAHWVALDRARGARTAHARRVDARFATDASGLARDPDVVCTSNDLLRDCIALVRRRVHIAGTVRGRGLSMLGARGATAAAADVAAFLAGEVDEARVLALARPLMAVAWWDWSGEVSTPASESVDAVYAVVRLAHLSTPLRVGGNDVSIAVDPEPIARLAAGDLGGALAVCLRRLRASGLAPVIDRAAGDARYARRIAASLAFPLSSTEVRRCARLVTRPFDTEEPSHAH